MNDTNKPGATTPPASAAPTGSEAEWIAETAKLMATEYKPEIAWKWALELADAHGPNGDLGKLSPADAAKKLLPQNKK